ncbi:hypothetical protein FDP41_003542 [Naegleria fowleri]|uniref:Uncharacterized protein n=1 Tax=Naegleria fowleri TaxID=5763 RepID=A0A6A5BUY1_NAEFO|nr:uncharacterized protein FDP41_003542 [Naegleria fowleri]KAF0977550.1 hypothetical protein FDP41_003542 [Naegleria fowleri]CAG4708376.1 unnamed protein product [Naegleria fowleri]
MTQKSKSLKSSNSTPTHLILLCGFPGSGKSTFATLCEKHGFVRINQDTLGDAAECKKLMEKSFKHNKSVVLDRCNIHPKDRKMWITEAKKLGVKHIDLVWFTTSPEQCKTNIRERKNHPTLPPENADKVVDEFSKGFKPPQKFEGPYENLFEVNNEKEGQELVKKLAQYLSTSSSSSSSSSK